LILALQMLVQLLAYLRRPAGTGYL